MLTAISSIKESFEGMGVGKSLAMWKRKPKNEHKQRLFIQSLLEEGSQPPLLVFWQRFKGRKRSWKDVSWKKGRLQVWHSWHKEAVGGLP